MSNTSDFFVYNPNHGLGDCISCFNTNKPIWSPSPHFSILKKYSSIPTLESPIGQGLGIHLLHDRDFGDHCLHLFNRVRIASGLEPMIEPKAILDLIDYKPVKNNIAFSFDVGAGVSIQTELHPRPRVLYPEHRTTIQEFISKNKDYYNFIEVGSKSFGFTDTIVKTGIGLDKTISLLANCKYYFGMHSGLMHLATAIGLKSNIIINFPSIERLEKSPDIFVPGDKMEWEKSWLYPQHRYLHEDDISDEYAITIDNLESLWR
jgi:hypothetical protein